MSAMAASGAPDWVQDAVELNKAWAESSFSKGSAQLPFSFIYNGKHSSEFIQSWDTKVQDRQPDPSKMHRTLTATDPETGLEGPRRGDDLPRHAGR